MHKQQDAIPQTHKDSWINLLHPYIASATQALMSGGIEVQRSWLDPCGPRDATILMSLNDEQHALVWDEETGWRTGLFNSGRQGERTTLLNTVYLGGGVLLDPRGLATRLRTGATAPRHQFRSHTDIRDGLDDALHAL